MRRVAMAVGLLTVLLGVARGAVYHVATNGMDGAAGSAAAPLRTVGEAAARMQAGDTCVVHAGRYRETVRPAASGTPAAPLRFEAAEGERVVFTGADAVADWRPVSNGVLRATVSWRVDQVFVDGAALTEARFPNAGTNRWQWPGLDFHVRTNSIVTNALLTQATNAWVGARVWGLSRRLGWVSGAAEVAASAPGELLLTGKKLPWYGGGAGRGLIVGNRTALDAPGEWCQAGDELDVLPPAGMSDLGSHDVEVTHRRWAFDLGGRSHIEVAGFDLHAAAINAGDATNCLIEACTIEWPSFDRDIRGGFNRDRGPNAQSPGLGVTLGGAHNTIRNCVVAYGTGDGITLFGVSNTVTNCVVHDVNLSATDCAPVTCTGEGHTITHSTLFNGGRSILVHRHLKRGVITHNHLYNAGLLSNDLGMTYTYQTDGEGTLIAYNLVHDNLGRKPGCVGIYLDDQTSRHIVHHNVVYGVTEAMAMNPPRSKAHLVYHNTLDGTIVSLGMYKSDLQDMTGTRFVNNILMTRLSLYMVNAEVGTNVFPGVDVRFTNREGRDYTLQPDSPAIDAGERLPGFNDDFAGAAPDMGAYESGRDPWVAGSSIPVSRWRLRPEWAVLPGHHGPCFEPPEAK